MSTPSAGSIPRPSWLKDLVGLHVESDLGKVVLLELFALRAPGLARHEHRGNRTEFDLVLWGFASQALKPCTFPSPLASLVNRDGLRARELGGLFDHLDRCVHLCFPHTAASRHRAEALEEVQKLKLDYIGMLNRRGYPRAALSLFRPERTLLDWFTPREAQAADENVSLVSFDFAGAKTDDPPARPSDNSAAFLTWNRAKARGTYGRRCTFAPYTRSLARGSYLFSFASSSPDCGSPGPLAVACEAPPGRCWLCPLWWERGCAREQPQ